MLRTTQNTESYCFPKKCWRMAQRDMISNSNITSSANKTSSNGIYAFNKLHQFYSKCSSLVWSFLTDIRTKLHLEKTSDVELIWLWISLRTNPLSEVWAHMEVYIVHIRKQDNNSILMFHIFQGLSLAVLQMSRRVK